VERRDRERGSERKETEERRVVKKTRNRHGGGGQKCRHRRLWMKETGVFLLYLIPVLVRFCVGIWGLESPQCLH
jgi:hypothetical protein